MPEISIATLVLTSSVVAAVTTHSLGWLKDKWTLDKTVKFSALVLATELEQYASECSALISDSTAYESTDGEFGSARSRLHELPSYSTDIDWKALGVTNANHAFSFRSQVPSLNAKIAGTFEYGDDDDGVREVRKAAFVMGLRALEIASSLRSENGIPPLEFDSEWNFKQHLEDFALAYKAEEIRMIERNKKLLDDLAAAGQPSHGA